jgi:hypothetical protein
MSEIIKCLDDKKLSRRQLLAGAGKAALGLTIVSAGAMSLTSGANAAACDEYPWPYKKLDPDRIAAQAYDNWYRHFCAYATAGTILGALQEEVGEPYTGLPLMAFAWGHGGGVGWGMTCGTIMGSGMAAAFAAGKDGENIINDVMNYYSDTALPIFKPEKPRATFKNTNKSDSPLCHVSVGKWMDKEGVTFFTPQRKDRCARLSADIAKKTVELLNLWADGNYKPAYGNQAKKHGQTAQNNCTDCHGS